MKLVITIDLDKFIRPSKDELDEVGMDELEYWIELLYADAPLVLDGAIFELVGDTSCSAEAA